MVKKSVCHTTQFVLFVGMKESRAKKNVSRDILKRLMNEENLLKKYSFYVVDEIKDFFRFYLKKNCLESKLY